MIWNMFDFETLNLSEDIIKIETEVILITSQRLKMVYISLHLFYPEARVDLNKDGQSSEHGSAK